MADKLDGKKTYTVECRGPATLTGEDLIDSLAFGVGAASQYLNDLHRDRTMPGDTVSEELSEPAT